MPQPLQIVFALSLVLALGGGCSRSENSAVGGSGGTAGGSTSSGGANAGGSNAGGTGPVGSGGRSASSGGAGGPSAEGTGGAGTGERQRPFDWVGVIGTGQSLSVGWEAGTISTTQPFKNLKLEDTGPDPKYPIDGVATARFAAVPLVEPIRKAVTGTGAGYDDSQYPNNIFRYNDAYGETPHSGMANTLSALWKGGGDYVTAHTVVGWSGHCLVDIDKQGGKRAYVASLAETHVFKALAQAAGKTYGVGGIVLTHGECDSGNAAYGAGLFRLWQDYNADLKAATGQERDVVLFASQQSSSESGPEGSAVQVWKAGVDHPGQVVCTGPKYQYAHSGGLHMPAAGYERLGQKYGEVFDLIVNQGVAWKPLGPKTATLAGVVITIDFDVPNPPLVWDANITPPHQTAHSAWAGGKGFEVVDRGGTELAIASAEIQGQAVALTLSQAPAPGAKLTVRYAITQDGTGYQGGTDQGLRGQLRDSDEFVGYDAETIEASVTNGSVTVSGDRGTFSRRAAHDIVTGTGLPENTIAAKNVYDDRIDLSAPWSGATGKATLSFRHDSHNYCVHFAIPVP